MLLLPRIYLGTMTFAWNQASHVVDDAVSAAMVQRFMASGGTRVDTARIYSEGETEPMLGRALKSTSGSSNLLVGTKAHPSQPDGLSAAGMRAQLQASLDSLGMTQVEEYYLHQPDTEHALLDSLREAHEMITEGVVKVVGMSNYHADEVERAFELCEEHGLTKPTVFQGLYNPLNRAVEDKLLPLLKRNSCSFVAYNPLAAGLLTGRHHQTGCEDVPQGRFKNNPNYLPRFYTDPNFQAVEAIRVACEAHDLTMVDATYCWLLRHSALSHTDGILLGASSLEQLDANLVACSKAKEARLPPEVRQAFDDAWKTTKQGAFPYWRSYSGDMPNRDLLPQGASYQAHGPK